LDIRVRERRRGEAGEEEEKWTLQILIV